MSNFINSNGGTFVALCAITPIIIAALIVLLSSAIELRKATKK
jgi:hypothetical protein